MNINTTPPSATPAKFASTETMKALVYQGPGKKALQDRPKPEIGAPTDAIVKITKNDNLRHRPAHPQGRRTKLSAWPHSGSRGRRHHREGRDGCHGVEAGRPGSDLVHQRLRQMRLL